MHQPLSPPPTLHSITLHLLAEELKMCRFFMGLEEAGLDNNSRYQLTLTLLIFDCMGIAATDSNVEIYMQRLEYHSATLEPDADYITATAHRFYTELLELKAT